VTGTPNLLEPCDVAPQRAPLHLQSLGKLRSIHAAMRLQKFQQSEHSSGGMIHGSSPQAALVGGAEWDEFPAISTLEKRMGGMVNLDEFVAPARGFSGMTLRVLNPETRLWAIYWISSRSGVLFPPVHGRFNGNRGEFYGEDMDDGKAVKVRFIWTKLGPEQARWEQAFSLEGEEWETNWIMDFTRA
jgi:hypothetical protein